MKKFDEWKETNQDQLILEFNGMDNRSLQDMARFITRVIEISNKENKEPKNVR